MKENIETRFLRTYFMELCLGFIKSNAKKINKSYFKMQKKACTNPLLIDIHVTSIKRKWQYT